MGLVARLLCVAFQGLFPGSGKSSWSFKLPCADCLVRSIAAHQDLIVIGTNATKPIYIYNYTTRALLEPFGEKGSEEWQLGDIIFGVDISSDGLHVLVTDTNNHRLSLFTLVGEYLRPIGVGSLTSPLDAKFTPAGDVVVADKGHNRICIFSAPSYFLAECFGGDGTELGLFQAPTALAIKESELYVLDNNNGRVQGFRLSDLEDRLH